MKVTNREIVQIYNCLQEVINCKEAKQEIPDSGKIIYAVVKSYNKIKPIFMDLSVKEKELQENLETNSTKENLKDLKKIYDKDIIDLFDNNEQEIVPHQMSRENFEVLQKYLSGAATVTLLNYMTIE